MSNVPENLPIYGDNIGAFIQPFGLGKSVSKVTVVESGITTLPVGTLIKITRGEVKKVTSPFKVLVTGFSGDVMNILYGVTNKYGSSLYEGTVNF